MRKSLLVILLLGTLASASLAAYVGRCCRCKQQIVACCLNCHNVNLDRRMDPWQSRLMFYCGDCERQYTGGWCNKCWTMTPASKFTKYKRNSK